LWIRQIISKNTRQFPVAKISSMTAVRDLLSPGRSLRLPVLASRKVWIGPTNPLLLAVRLALAMGEVVQRAGSAFHLPPKSISDYLRDMIFW